MLESISKAEGVITLSADFLSIKDRISKSSLVRRNFVRQLARVLGISKKEAKVRDKAEIWRKEVPKYCSGDEFGKLTNDFVNDPAFNKWLNDKYEYENLKTLLDKEEDPKRIVGIILRYKAESFMNYTPERRERLRRSHGREGLNIFLELDDFLGLEVGGREELEELKQGSIGNLAEFFGLDFRAHAARLLEGNKGDLGEYNDFNKVKQLIERNKSDLPLDVRFVQENEPKVVIRKYLSHEFKKEGINKENAGDITDKAKIDRAIEMLKAKQDLKIITTDEVEILKELQSLSLKLPTDRKDLILRKLILRKQ